METATDIEKQAARRVAAQKLRLELARVAEKFWEERGAQIGKEQGLGDINTSDCTMTLPKKFTEQTRFITEDAVIEFGGYDGRTISCTLWVRPLKRDGQPGAPVRLTSLTLYSYLLG